MLRCIKEVKPRWVIGENVRGLVNWNEGMVFNEVYDDLEREGYEVQSFLIPAAGVNAPHQRYRIWFVAYSTSIGFREHSEGERLQSKAFRTQFGMDEENATYSNSSRIHKQHFASKSNKKIQSCRSSFKSRDFTTFPTEPPICGGDDGIPKELDSITFSKWRNQSIKAYGNAIVPQVAYQIFKTINEFESLSS
jgi:DNA (cytosine-5)-methyltransferase 1